MKAPALFIMALVTSCAAVAQVPDTPALNAAFSVAFRSLPGAPPPADIMKLCSGTARQAAAIADYRDAHGSRADAMRRNVEGMPDANPYTVVTRAVVDMVYDNPGQPPPVIAGMANASCLVSAAK